MGKVPTATAITEMTNKRKKKGRPFKNPPPISTPPKPPLSNSTSRRFTRRNPNHLNSPPLPEFDDDDDERKEKKVKLVVRLPQSDDKSVAADKYQGSRHSNDSDSGSDPGSGSESDPEDEDRDGYAKKRKVIGVDRGSDDEGLDQDKKVVKETETPLHGSPLDSGPTTPLPDKKILVFILDRLQKKDTYRVFSEPVDPDELPDYFDIIKQPMDFSTVRKKLDDGQYKNLEELEADVCLICSNAMEYNGSDTVYFRQARSIQELAKRDFKNLKSEGDDGAPQPKVVRRGRPPSNKNQKKPLEASLVDRVGTELSSGATLANGEDKASGSNSYNLRKASPLFRSRYTESYGSRNGENQSEWSADWNNEFPASILRADMKHSKKLFTVDENKRDTYREYLSLSSNNLPILYMKRLVPVGLQETLGYARSLSRYAANLGPVAWKLASKKIETVLPPGVQYGRGWVGDNGTTSQPLHENQKPSNSTPGDCSSSSKLAIPSTSDHLNSAVPEGLVEAVRKLNSQNELAGTQFPPQQNQMHHPNRNGFTGMFGHAIVPSVKVETGNVEQAKSPESSSTGFQRAQVKASNSNGEAETRAFVKSSWPVQQRHGLAGPPDLNVRVPAGSPGSSLQIGSPQQPDLALQL